MKDDPTKFANEIYLSPLRRRAAKAMRTAAWMVSVPAVLLGACLEIGAELLDSEEQ